jgi:hypothetical protein
MRKAKILALAIATILTAYILALTLSNQAYAQEGSIVEHEIQLLLLAAHETQQEDKVLSGIEHEIGGLATESGLDLAHSIPER